MAREGLTKFLSPGKHWWQRSGAAPPESVRGAAAPENAAIIRRVLAGEASPARDVVVINAAAALVAAGIAPSFREAANLAGEALSSGAAADKLAALAAFTNAG